MLSDARFAIPVCGQQKAHPPWSCRGGCCCGLGRFELLDDELASVLDVDSGGEFVGCHLASEQVVDGVVAGCRGLDWSVSDEIQRRLTGQVALAFW